MPSRVRWAALAGGGAAAVVFLLFISSFSLSGLWARGPYMSDLFDDQARALVHGHLDVTPEVAGIEGIEVHGRTYVYFGIFPAIARLPLRAFGDATNGRTAPLMMLLALSVALVSTARLAWSARRALRGDGPVTTVEAVAIGLFTFAAGASSPLLLLATAPVAYMESALWAAAWSIAFLAQLVAVDDPPTRRQVLVLGATATAAVLSRASVGVLCLAGIFLLAGVLLVRRRGKQRVVELLVAGALVTLCAVGVNQARFGSPVSVPWEHQVYSVMFEGRREVLEATDGSLFSPSYLPLTIAQYFGPDAVDLEPLPPFIGFPHAPSRARQTPPDALERSTSLPDVAPALVLLGVAGAVAAMVRWRQRWRWVIAGGAAVVGAAPTLAFSSIANRHLADFAPALFVFAALGLWAVLDLAARRRHERAALVGLVVIGALGVAVGTSLTLLSSRLYFFPDETDRASFIRDRYRLGEALGIDPPHVQRLSALPDGPAPTGGQLVILGDCDQLVWRDDDSWDPAVGWVVLEAAPQPTPFCDALADDVPSGA